MPVCSCTSHPACEKIAADEAGTEELEPIL